VLRTPGRIVDLTVERLEPDDYSVTFTLDSGETEQLCGRDFYDPPLPFEDAADVWGFLLMQSTPADLLQRELDSVSPHWEELVAASNRSDLDALREQDHLRRADLRAAFLRKR
jgi:hypothetical protein